MTPSKQALSDYVFQSKYSLYLPHLKRKETWEESVERIKQMHLTQIEKVAPQALGNEWFMEKFNEAIQFYKDKKLVGSQRNLQFGGEPVLKTNAKSYNCSYTHLDRLRAFKETAWMLLCGCGVGLSVEQMHIDKLPNLLTKDKINTLREPFLVDDSIEGWAEAFEALIYHYFYEDYPIPEFDFSAIRPSGALIANRFVAPGPDGLKKSLQLIDKLLTKAISNNQTRLTALQCTDIISFIAESVLSGGVRRSACIILFTPEDEEMVNCKTGDWFTENPQRARFNMSAALTRDKVSYDTFSGLFEAMRRSGDPGLYFREIDGTGCNPCCEIGFYPIDKNGVTGWQVCNLVSINGLECTNVTDFYKYCEAASTLATVQAIYNSFPFLGEATENIIKDDPLIGVSIGGIMNNPQVLLDRGTLRAGANIVKSQNEKVARVLGINPASRTTCVKPDGTVSLLLGMTSGIHGAYARKYLRSVEANIEEPNLKAYEEANPQAVQTNIFKPTTDKKIFFPIEEDNETVLREKLHGINLLEAVKLVQQSWVKEGARDYNQPVHNNVSNTVDVYDGEWDEVKKWVWDNKDYVSGISFLSSYGDIDLPQAPMCKVNTIEELMEYGEGALFASGLITDILKVYNDLWTACEVVQGRREKIFITPDMVTENMKKEGVGYTQEEIQKIMANLELKLFDRVKGLSQKRDIIRRINKFANNYFGGDVYKAINVLKRVNNIHYFKELQRTYTPINWDKVEFEKEQFNNANELGAMSCSGGSCEIK